MYQVEAAATDDRGAAQAFVAVGTVLVFPAEARCAGDCDGGGTVTIEEIVAGINAALSGATPVACAALDTGGDGAIAVSELVAAIDRSLHGCPQV
jgi:hypothetical protein